MKHSPFPKILALLLVSIMLIGVIPTTAFAAKDSYDDSNGGSNYYNLISERSWDIAPGVKEYEQVLNNAGATRRQVMHAAVVDLNNPYVKVIPGYKGMIPTPGKILRIASQVILYASPFRSSDAEGFPAVTVCVSMPYFSAMREMISLDSSVD